MLVEGMAKHEGFTYQPDPDLYWKQGRSTEHDFTSEQKINRYSQLKTLENLTLITKRLNSKLKNAAWVNKKKTLKNHSSLKITTDYLEKEQWDESTIAARAGELAKLSLQIWKRE